MKKTTLDIVKRTYRPMKEHFKRYLVCMILCEFFGIAFNLVMPTTTKFLIDAIALKSHAMLLQGVLIFLSVFLLYIIFVPITAYFYEASTQKPHLVIRFNILKHLLNVPYLFVLKQKTVDFMTKTTNDLESLLDFYKSDTANVLSTVMLGIGTFAISLSFDLRLTVVVCVVGMFKMLTYRYKHEEIVKYNKSIRENIVMTNEQILNILDLRRVVRAFKADELFFDKYVGALSQNVKQNLKLVSYENLKSAVSSLIDISGVVAILGLGTYWASQGSLTIGDVLAVFMLRENIFVLFNHIGKYIIGIKVIFARSTPIFDFLDIPAESADIEYDETLPANENSIITVDDLGVSYDEKKILDGLSFRVTPSEKIAIVGSSGAGKSTLLRVLCGLIEPESGSVYFRQNRANMATLRKNCAYASQDPYLFTDTVMNNLRICAPDATDEEVFQAAKMACAHDFICEMPEGYNSALGERGCTLSGGQIQRIAIARALVQNAPVLVLDEATSALDIATEAKLFHNLKTHYTDTTILIAAHRDTIINACDRVFMVSGQSHKASCTKNIYKAYVKETNY